MQNKNPTFIAALCRANETKLVGAARFKRMAECASLEEALTVLGESGFGGENSAAEGYERMIAAEKKSFISFIKENSPDAACKAHFLIPYDFKNAEALVKSTFLGLNPEKYLCEEGAFGISELMNYIVDGKDCGLYDELKSAVDFAKDGLKKGEASGAKINAFFVKKKFECLTRLSKHSFFRDIIEREVTAANISACLRSNSIEQVNDMLISVKNGKKTITLTPKQVKALVEKNAIDLKKAFETSEYKGLATLALEKSVAGLPLIELEREANGFGATFLDGEKYTELSGEFVFSHYCYKRKNELYCAELCLTAKANGVTSEEIIKRLIAV